MTIQSKNAQYFPPWFLGLGWCQIRGIWRRNLGTLFEQNGYASWDIKCALNKNSSPGTTGIDRFTTTTIIPFYGSISGQTEWFLHRLGVWV